MDFTTDENIIVCSSGQFANVAITKLRISGEINFEQLNPYFSKDLTKISPRYVYYTDLIDEGEVIDDVILTFFNSPNSFTGEDVIELDVHGNQLNVDRIIDLFISKLGFRYAVAGEFSYRALKNKKISLSQVEGLDLVLNANSIFSLKQGRSLLSGKIKDHFQKLYDAFLKHKSTVELLIDFSDDLPDEQAKKLFDQSLKELTKIIAALQRNISDNSGSLLAPKVSFVGSPNSGKSTLFNELLQEQRSIVTDMAGTTRDFISENVVFGDVRFKLIDTAGIRETTDRVEELGVKKTLQIVGETFFNCLVINPFEFSFGQGLELSKIDLIIFTHSDKDGFLAALEACLEDFLESGPIEPVRIFGPMGACVCGPIEPIELSGPIEPTLPGPMGALDFGPIEPGQIAYIEVGKEDYQELEAIKELAVIKYNKIVEQEPFLLERHKEMLLKIHSSVSNYNELVKSEPDIAIVASELSALGYCISELIGIVSPDDVLRNIFSNFCIGK